MTTEGGIDKETFIRMAGVAGLDTDDLAHLEELHAYVQSVLPSLKAIKELDLTNVEPTLVYLPPKE